MEIILIKNHKVNNKKFKKIILFKRIFLIKFKKTLILKNYSKPVNKFKMIKNNKLNYNKIYNQKKISLNIAAIILNKVALKEYKKNQIKCLLNKIKINFKMLKKIKFNSCKIY